MMRPAAARAFSLFLLAFLAACAEKPPPVSYEPRSFAELPGWEQDDLSGAAQALRRSCPPNAAKDESWREVCAALPDGGDNVALRAYFTRNFEAFQIVENGKDEGLFTGYYEAEINGSRERRGRYTIPVYGAPEDLLTADLGAFKPELQGQRISGRVEGKRFVPYPDRAAITAGAKKIDAPVLLWTDDSAALFFLQVQGSGRALMEDGAALRLGYGAQNGRPYVAIGRILKERGELPQDGVTMASIRAWLAAHDKESAELLNLNPSYVFFKLAEGDPRGAQGVELTPERSLAVDRNFIALGSPVWIDAESPDAKNPAGGEERLRRLFIAQDTGGAIKGAIRGDVYWGYGARAAELAGKMQSRGRAYILRPRKAPVS
ncbi:MAG: MltA domain-containing protein [Alphaproteobacteria bacterium]